MKSSKLSPEARKLRREAIMGKRNHMHRAHDAFPRIIDTESPAHSSTRQRARYARQIAAGQINF